MTKQLQLRIFMLYLQDLKDWNGNVMKNNVFIFIWSMEYKEKLRVMSDAKSIKLVIL